MQMLIVMSISNKRYLWCDPISLLFRMRLTHVLSKHILGRWYNDIWKQKKKVTVDSRKLREALEAEGKKVYDAAKLFGVSWEDREQK